MRQVCVSLPFLILNKWGPLGICGVFMYMHVCYYARVDKNPLVFTPEEKKVLELLLNQLHMCMIACG